MSKFDLPKRGDYVTIHDCSNFKTVYIVIECRPLRVDWSHTVVQLIYTAECEMHSTKKLTNGDFIWDKTRTKCVYAGVPYFCSNFRTDNMKPATDAEKSITNIALAKLGVIWNPVKQKLDDRPLPDISNGLTLNDDSKYCWHKVLKPYIGKVFFEEREDSFVHPYESNWASIWQILLKEKLEREKKTGKKSPEMEDHMFEVLRTIYQAPLLKVSYDFESEKYAHKAFLVSEKKNRFDEERGFVMGEPKLHLITDMYHQCNGVGRVDLYKKIADDTYTNLKLYFPK
jgi:hypothetical protein